MANEPVTAETPEERFGALLRRERERAGLTVRQLADRLHRAHSGIVEFERGRRLPGPDTVEQIEDVLGLGRGALGAARERARVQRLEWPRDGTVETNLGHVPCPYMGLRAFESEDAPLYYGRETQVHDVLTRLAATRFVAVVGASGSGKSSFVRAGLLAGIGRTGSGGGLGTRIALLTPTHDPVAALASAVGAAPAGRQPGLAEDLRADPRALLRVVRRGRGALVIAVDQFEELFTLCHDEASRRCFVDALVSAWRDPASPVTVIVSLRADFYGRIAAYPELAAGVVSHQELIGPMSAADLRRAIELPAAGAGLMLQPGLAETMLDDLAGQPGSLPLLAHALLETFKRRRRLQLTLSGYQEAGGVRGAIAQTAEQTLQSMAAADRDVARWIFVSLTDLGEGAEPTGRRVDRADLAAAPRDGARVERVLGMLADARLVSVDERGVALAHEALIGHWPRLRGWIDADRAGLVLHRRLANAAREWDNLDREEGALYRGGRLATARDWAEGHPGDLSSLEREFLAACESHEEAEVAAARRRAARLRYLAGGLAALSLVVAALAAWALGQRRDARQRTTEARSIALASYVTPLLGRRPDIALPLSLAASGERPVPEARASAVTALNAARPPGLLAIMRGPAPRFQAVAFSRDGRTLASASTGPSDDGTTIALWDVRTHKRPGPVLQTHGDVTSMAFSPDGETLAATGGTATIRLFDVRRRRLIRDLGRPLEGGVDYDRVAFSRDGRTLVATGVRGFTGFWDVRTGRQLRAPLTGAQSIGVVVAYLFDRRTLASEALGRRIRSLEARVRERLVAPLHGSVLQAVIAISGDGHRFAYQGADGTVWIWDMRLRKHLGVATRLPRPLRGPIELSCDGGVLAYLPRGDSLLMWDVPSGGRVPSPPIGTRNLSLAFSCGAEAMATAGAEPYVRLWDPLAGRSKYRLPNFDPNGPTMPLLSRDGSRIAYQDGDGRFHAWDVWRQQDQVAPRSPGGEATSLTLSPDGRTLGWVIPSSGLIELWNGREHHSIRARPVGTHAPGEAELVFSSDTRTLLYSDFELLEMWDVGTRKLVGSPIKGMFDALAKSPSGPIVAARVDDGEAIVLLNPRAGPRPLWRLPGQGSSNGLTFSKDGGILMAREGATVRMWDVRARKALSTLLGHEDGGGAWAYGPGGRILVVADGTSIRTWDMRTRKALPTLTGHSVPVTDMTFSPDGNTLASLDFDASVRLWDLRLGEAIGPPLALYTPYADQLAFAHDGRSLVALGLDGKVQLWERLLPADVGELRKQVCDIVGDGLSKDEWRQYAPRIPFRRTCP